MSSTGGAGNEDPVVVDSGSVARAVGAACGFEMVSAPRSRPGGRACVVVIERDDDAQVIAGQLGTGPPPFDAVVAWGLSEEAVLGLLEAGVPVVCGMPDPVALREATAGWPDDVAASARATAATLASIEAELLHAATRHEEPAPDTGGSPDHRRPPAASRHEEPVPGATGTGGSPDHRRTDAPPAHPTHDPASLSHDEAACPLCAAQG